MATVVCHTAALAVYLLLFSASHYLHSLSTASAACYRRSTCIDMDMLRFLDMGWMGTAWPTMRLISVEKDWKHVLTQKVVTLNTCCDTACLTFQLPHISALETFVIIALHKSTFTIPYHTITNGSFQSHRRQPTTGSFQSLQRLKEHNKLQSDEKILQFKS